MWLLPNNHPAYSACAAGSAASNSQFDPSSPTPVWWVSLSGTLTPRPSSWRGWKRRPWSRALFGAVISTSSTLPPSLVEWISSPPDSPASHSVAHQGGDVLRSTCGRKCSGSSARSGPAPCSLRTSRASRWCGPDASSGHSATAAAAISSPTPPPWVPRIDGCAPGFLPTLTRKANCEAPSMQKWPASRRLRALTDGKRAPVRFWEWMQGFPIGWTASAASATPSSPPKAQPHSASCSVALSDLPPTDTGPTALADPATPTPGAQEAPSTDD